jgi:hypothetical protein
MYGGFDAPSSYGYVESPAATEYSTLGHAAAAEEPTYASSYIFVEVKSDEKYGFADE